MQSKSYTNCWVQLCLSIKLIYINYLIRFDWVQLSAITKHFD